MASGPFGLMIHCTLSGHVWGHRLELGIIDSAWSCGSPPLALKGGYSPSFWVCPPTVTCRNCLCLLPSRRCLSVFSFSPFLVKVSSREVHEVQDGWQWVGKRGSQSSSSSRNDGFTPVVLSQDCYKRQVLVIG